MSKFQAESVSAMAMLIDRKRTTVQNILSLSKIKAFFLLKSAFYMSISYVGTTM